MKASIVLLVCILCAGCTPTTDPGNIGNPLLNSAFWFVSPGGYISADDTVNTRAIIMLEQYYVERKSWTAVPDEPPFTEHYATAAFHSMIPGHEPQVDIVINDSVINDAKGWWVGGYNDRRFQTYFTQGTSSNTMHKVADAYLGAIDTTVNFGEAVRFTNVSKGDVVDISEGKTFSLSGPSGNMQISLLVHSAGANDHTGNHSSTKLFYGMGSVTLTSDDLRGFAIGYGEVEITRWEMKFLPTSNGTKIAFVARTSHRVAVQVVK